MNQQALAECCATPPPPYPGRLALWDGHRAGTREGTGDGVQRRPTMNNSSAIAPRTSTMRVNVSTMISPVFTGLSGGAAYG